MSPKANVIWTKILTVALTSTIAAPSIAEDRLQYQTGVLQLTENSPLILGRGVNTVAAEARGDCVDFPTNGPSQRGQSVLEDSQVVTNRNDLDTFLEISASMQASGLSGFGGSASFNMSHSLTINSYDVTYVAKVTVVNDARVIRDVEIKPAILIALINQKDPALYFSETCGDSYVSSLVEGGDFFASVYVNTKSTKEASNASAQLSASYSLISGSAGFTSAVKSLQQTSSTKISMTRSGGSGVELIQSVDDLTARASAFPKDVAAAPWRLRAVTQSYAAVFNLPEQIRTALRGSQGTTANKVQLYQRANDAIDRINYITTHSDQFYLDPFDVPKLAEEINTLTKYRDNLGGRIKSCLLQGEMCNEATPPVPESQIYPGRK